MKIRISLLLALTLALSGCGQAESTEDTWSDAVRIEFSDDSVTVDGNAASADSAVYTENDIIFYLEGQGVTYGEGTEADAHSQAEATPTPWFTSLSLALMFSAVSSLQDRSPWIWGKARKRTQRLSLPWSLTVLTSPVLWHPL